jgi:predicted nucleotidyltransferase
MEGEERDLEGPLKEEVERGDYATAASMAEQLEKPGERVREVQEAAIKQYITEYRNASGAMALVQEYRFTDDEIDRLLEGILEEARRSEGKRPPWARKCYDAKTMKYLDIEEWISQYGKTLRRAKGQ